MLKKGFFKEKQAAAVLKHGVLQRYLQPFVSKTGSTAPDNRVVYLDGYAGPGTYDDGTPGSPILAATTAQKVEDLSRQLRCIYVEKKAEYCDTLEENLEAYPHDFIVHRGTIEKHLPVVLQESSGYPLFAFFDPFGLALPFDALTEDVLGRPMWPATEVLLNFSLPGLRRNAGKKSQPAAQARVDATLGGIWWRDVWDSGAEDREEQIVREYVRRVSKAAGGGWGWWTIPVAKRWEGPTWYCLIFFSHHRDGLWIFNQCLSKAMEDFHDYCFGGQRDLLLEQRWVEHIAENIEGLLASVGAFVVRDRIADVYGEALGYARETHVRQAIKRLYAAGGTATNGVGKIVSMLILPPDVQ